jgi:redox-sensitive bicupin YhaK (pirin superfamily)
MYHGETVPGFPKHPHRGFETVTVARSGLVDHSDSLGAAGRFGNGDVQWMTAGKGISHSEMFPLLNRDGPNRIELFQIWMNLPARNKMVEPFFTMLWADQVPKLSLDGGGVEVAVVSGAVSGTSPARPPPCPPNSWAAQPGAGVSIITVKLLAGKGWTLPGAALPGLNRSVYFYAGSKASVGDQSVPVGVKVDCDAARDLIIANR